MKTSCLISPFSDLIDPVNRVPPWHPFSPSLTKKIGIEILNKILNHYLKKRGWIKIFT